MTLATFFPKISAALRRGTSLDVSIPGWVEDAALWLEQNYTFSYMRRTEAGVLAIGENLIELAGTPKVVQFVRAISRSNDNQYRYLRKVGAHEVTSIDNGDPNYYWVEETHKVFTDAFPELELDLAVGGVFYTEWPADTGQTPTLLRLYPNLLKYQTLILAAIDLKDERMAAAYDAQFQRVLAAVLNAEEEAKQTDTSESMQPASVFQ